MELLVVQYCREDADFNKKNYQDRTKNAKVKRFQNLPNFAKNFTQFLGYTVLSGCKLWGRKQKPEVFRRMKDDQAIFSGKMLEAAENFFIF